MNRKLLPETQVILDSSPKFKPDDIKWLWNTNYYDGPLEGMMEIKSTGQRVWAFWIDETEWTEQCGPEQDDHELIVVRFFGLYELTPEQQKSEEYWHELFRLCVGEHCDYEEDGKTRKNVKAGYSNESFKFFYTRSDMDREKLDLTKSELIGWFEW